MLRQWRQSCCAAIREAHSFHLPPLSLLSSASHITHLAHLRDLVPPNYHHFLDPIQVHAPYLVPLFQVEFCAINKLAREAPLKTAVEVGTGGALMKIMKVRQVMKQRGNEWSQANELPVRPNSSRLATLLFAAKG